MHQRNEAATDGCETPESRFPCRHGNGGAGVYHLDELFERERNQAVTGTSEEHSARGHRAFSRCSSWVIRSAIRPTGST
jgi:hypothetical protein